MSEYSSLSKAQRRLVWDKCVAPLTQSILARLLTTVFWIVAFVLVSQTSLFDKPLRESWYVIALVWIAQDMVVEPLVVLMRRSRVRNFAASVQIPRPGLA